MKMPAWYAWLALVLSTAASAGFSAIVSIQVAERTVETDRAAREQAAEAGRRATCNVVLTQLAIYDAVPPSTKIQQEAFRAWTGMHDLYQCNRG